MTCGPVPVRSWEASSAKVTSRTWCRPFSVPPEEVGEQGGAGLGEGEAGDCGDGHRPPSPGPKVAGLAGDLEDLGGVREPEVADRDRLEGAQLDAAVRTVAGAVQFGARAGRRSGPGGGCRRPRACLESGMVAR